MKKNYLWTAVKAALIIPTASLSMSSAIAQDATASDETEVIEVRGLISSLKRSFSDKKEALIVSDGIAAEDLGKFPDQNVAESLQRITGVSIDRSGGEGQLLSVRGFGPQFNLVTVNGRQLATENPGREFSFDTLAAELISGADVYKTSNAANQEGGIGAQVNLKTAKPFQFDGFKAAGSVKGTYDTLSEGTTPSFSGLVSNTFNDNTMGVLFSVSHQTRDAQVNQADTRGFYKVDSIQTNDYDAVTGTGKIANSVWVPRNLDLTVNEEDRKRTTGTLVFQYAPSDDITLTVDGLYSKFNVESQVTNLANWFTPGNFRDFTVDSETDTVVMWSHNAANDPTGGGSGATDFVQQGLDRNVEIKGFGFNAEWQISDELLGSFDVSTSNAKDESGDQSNVFTVIGYPNGYTYDATSGGLPSLAVDGVDGAFSDPSELRSHYVQKGGADREDDITELKADFVYEPDSETFTQMRFGIYRQDRTKTSTNYISRDQAVFDGLPFTGPNCYYCNYGSPIPSDLVSLISPNDWFEGIPSSIFSYDPEDYFAWLESDAGITAQTAHWSTFLPFDLDPAEAIAFFDSVGGYTPARLGTSFEIEEEVSAVYFDFVFQGDLGDMPWTVNAGFRYSETSTTASGEQNQLLDIGEGNDPTILAQFYDLDSDGNQIIAPITIGNSYTNLLPSFNVKLEVEENMLLRFGYSETLTRPTMTDMRPVTNIGTTRPDLLLASGGNPGLNPFLSTNWDISYEWYYGDASALSIGIFSKEVEGFITQVRATETFSLASGDYDFEVTRPRNGETAKVDGLELAWTHTWESGFGIQANATKVASDAEVDVSDSSQTFALEGLGDSQNLIGFYEKDGFQARIAFNNREGFLQTLSNADTGEPEFVETYGQWDISASYDINETFNVFFEGVNVTDEEVNKHGRLASHFTEQVLSGSRYSIGVRGSF
jgi:TonB-dependent receptor